MPFCVLYCMHIYCELKSISQHLKKNIQKMIFLSFFFFLQDPGRFFCQLQIECMITCVALLHTNYCRLLTVFVTLRKCVCFCVYACVCFLPRGWVGGQVSLCSVVIILFIFILLWVVIEVCVNFWLVCFILCPFFLFWEAVSLSSSSLYPSLPLSLATLMSPHSTSRDFISVWGI